MDTTPTPIQSSEISHHFSQYFQYKKIMIIFLVLIVVAITIFFIVRERRREIKPLDAGLFHSIEKDSDIFSEDASFFDEQEVNLEKINNAYENQ